MDFNVTSRKRAAPSTTQAPGAFGADSRGNLAAGSSAGWKASAGGGGATGCQLSMYDEAPVGEEVALEQFEEFALDRLRVLKSIDDAKARGTKPDELDIMVSDIWRKHMRAGCSLPDARRKDVISHYILRLAYCRTEELRRWLLVQESALFRHRFRIETPENQRWFLESNGLPYRAIGSAEMTAVREKVTLVARSLNQPVPNADSVYYKVPFEEVPDLVGSRRVYLEKGFAFVPRDQLAAIVVGQFRAKLSKALVITNRKWLAHIQEDEQERLTPVIEALSTRYLGPDYTQPGEAAEVSLRDLDGVARQSFPLCMRHLFFKVREEHHLRHGGRMQLGLFLKGIGLRLEDALTFWRSEFSKKVLCHAQMGAERFDKEYAYSIRHNYGKEGKRTDYTPFSCVKIIMSTPGVGDHHGCPFKHFSEDNLRAALSRMGVTSVSAKDEIVQKTRQQHYQISCAMTFEASQGAPCPSGITHPNQYFMLSRQTIEGRAPPAPVQMQPQQQQQQQQPQQPSPVQGQQQSQQLAFHSNHQPERPSVPASNQGNAGTSDPGSSTAAAGGDVRPQLVIGEMEVDT